MSTNENHFCMSPTPPGQEVPVGQYFATRAAFLNGNKWQPGEVITVRFLGGTPALQRRVRDVAKEWEQYANLTFNFVDAGPAEIRIAFIAGNGSWSYIGTDCRHIPADQPTMNYGWLTDQSSDDELRRVVLHEFGHAIGMIHEHQNPTGGIRWNRAAVIHDLSRPPNSWKPETIENNMFRQYSDVSATHVDATSIMMYPIPKSWTEDGFSAGLNASLSASDKQKTSEVYPR